MLIGRIGAIKRTTRKLSYTLTVMIVLLISAIPSMAEINVLYMAQAGYQPDEYIEMARSFEAETGIKVNISFENYDDQYEKIVAEAKKPISKYDVILLDLIWTAEFGGKYFVLPLDNKLTPAMKKDIAPVILDAFIYADQIWAMPFLANFHLFFYNMDYIIEAGFSRPPKTLEELEYQMRVMKQKGIIKHPWFDSWREKEVLVCEYIWLTGAFGGNTFSEKGEPIFNNGPGLKALQFMVNLLDEGLANPMSLEADELLAKDVFISGDAAFTSNWTFLYAFMNNPEVSNIVGAGKIGFLPVAEEFYDKYEYYSSSVSGFQGLAIMSNSQHPHEAWQYIRFITAPEVQRTHLEEMPVWLSIQNDPEVRSIDPVMELKVKELASVHHRPKLVDYYEVSTIMQKYIFLALKKKLTPKEALDKAVKEIRKSRGREQ